MTLQRAENLLGLRNMARPARQPFGAMATADNVDHTNSMTLECRAGSVKVLDLSDVTSGYSTRDERSFFTVEAGVINRRDILFNQNGTASANVVTYEDGIGLQALCWDDEGQTAVCMGGGEGFLFADAFRKQLPLRVPTPNPPDLHFASGSLPVGQYLFTVNLRHKATGMEGGTPQCAVANVTSPCAVVIDSAPVAGYDTLVWATPTDGGSDALYFLGVNATTFDEPMIDAMSYPLPAEQFQRDPAPDGATVCAFHGGRLYVAQDNWVAISEYGAYHLFNFQQNTFPFVGNVVGMQSTREGMLIGTDKAIYLFRAPGDQDMLLEFGALPWRPFWRDQDGLCVFGTKRGFYAFPPLKPLTFGKFAPPLGTRLFATARRQMGNVHCVFLTDAATVADNAY